MPYLSLAFTVALVAGLVCGVLFDLRSMHGPSVVLAAASVAAALAYQRHWARGQLAAFTAGAMAAGWLLGSSSVDRAMNPPLRVLLEQRRGGFAMDGADVRREEPIVIEGRILRDAARVETGIALRVAIERVFLGPCPEAADGGVALTVTGALGDAALGEWTTGRRVRLPALLRRPARYLDWGVPDQERAMARRGIALVGTVKSAALVELLARGRWWEEGAAWARAVTRAAIARHVAARDAQAAAIATALVIGDRAGISHEVERRLQEAGTYHVIAISGGNIAILASLVLGALSCLGVRGRLAALVAIAVLASYAVVASGGASVARATLMATLYLALRLIDQRTAPANAIALSAAVLLLLNPLTIFDVGFWLTFGATGAILLGAARIGIMSMKWVAVVTMLLVATVCAEVALAPVAALTFQRVTLAGLPLNFIAIPCMSLVQVSAMVLVIADLLGADVIARGLAVVVELGTHGLLESTRLLDVAPWLTWRVPPPLVAVVVAYYGAVALWWWTSRRAAGAVAVALFLWIIIAPPTLVRIHGDGQLHVSVIDVGQGDALYVAFPNGRAMVVDTGGVTVKGEFDVGDRVIGPALRARSLLALEYLAVTHGDPDHIGGARALVRDFAPREVWWGVPVANHEPTAIVRAESDRARGTWRTLQRGDRFEVGGVEVRVHHPPPPEWERQKVRNNDSLVLELRFGSVSILLTGDIGREIEEELLAHLDLLPTVVLKVPHHGSGTSSSEEFVEKLRPTVALIGVGRLNPYGHPVPYVLDRYHRAGTEIFRTDRDGQIELSTDGAALAVRTFTGLAWQKERHEGTKDTKEMRGRTRR